MERYVFIPIRAIEIRQIAYSKITERHVVVPYILTKILFTKNLKIAYSKKTVLKSQQELFFLTSTRFT